MTTISFPFRQIYRHDYSESTLTLKSLLAHRHLTCIRQHESRNRSFPNQTACLSSLIMQHSLLSILVTLIIHVRAQNARSAQVARQRRSLDMKAARRVGGSTHRRLITPVARCVAGQHAHSSTYRRLEAQVARRTGDSTHRRLDAQAARCAGGLVHGNMSSSMRRRLDTQAARLNAQAARHAGSSTGRQLNGHAD